MYAPYAPYVAPAMEVSVAKPPPKVPKPKKHPSARYFTLATLLYVCGFILALIAIFLPWSKHDLTASGYTAWIGLFDVCIYQNDYLSTFTCTNVDLDNVMHPAGATQKCRDYYTAVQVLSIITAGMALVGVIMVALLLKKLWTKTAMAIAGASLTWWILTLGCAIAAWACWLVWGEENCNGTISTGLITAWPVQGYTWGFILECIASGLFLMGILLHCVGCASLKKPVYTATPTLTAAPAYPVAPSYPIYPTDNTSPYMAPVYNGY